MSRIIQDYINQTELLQEFVTLAGFDSESFHEKEIAAYLTAKIKNLGLEVTVDSAGELLGAAESSAGNIYGFLKGNTDGEPILFAAHMDTVAPGNGKQVVLHGDGRVTSDGTTVLGADDLTGVAAILEMLKAITANNLPHPDIEVIFYVAEEPYARGSAVFDYSKVKAKRAYVLDLSGPIGGAANRAPSILQFTAEIKGKSAHAGFEPEKGISAIRVVSEAIAGLRLGRIDEETTANIGTINGGTGKNIVPETVVVEGEVRSLNHAKAIAAMDEIRTQLEQTASVHGASVTFRSEEMIRAYYVGEDSPVVQDYCKAVRELGYGEANIDLTLGGSDNNNLNKYGIEGLVISNAMNKVHTTEEYFEVGELVKSANIILWLACRDIFVAGHN